MFKLFRTVQLPGKMPVLPQNHFHTYAITMPMGLLPILQSRLTIVILTGLYGKGCPHDLYLKELLELDRLLTDYNEPGQHNLVLDGRLLSLLKRFIQTERLLVSHNGKRLMLTISNVELWIMLGDLLESIQRPTRIVSLSFFGQ